MTTRLGPCGFVWFLFALALGGVCAVLISQGLARRREVPTTEVKIATSCGRVTDVVLLADDGTVTGRSTLATSVGTCRERLDVVTVPVRAEVEPEPVRAPAPKHVPQPRWQRTGESFETLTLSPSVNVGGCWHGFVRSGEVTSC